MGYKKSTNEQIVSFYKECKRLTEISGYFLNVYASTELLTIALLFSMLNEFLMKNKRTHISLFLIPFQTAFAMQLRSHKLIVTADEYPPFLKREKIKNHLEYKSLFSKLMKYRSIILFIFLFVTKTLQRLWSSWKNFETTRTIRHINCITALVCKFINLIFMVSEDFLVIFRFICKLKVIIGRSIHQEKNTDIILNHKQC